MDHRPAEPAVGSVRTGLQHLTVPALIVLGALTAIGPLMLDFYLPAMPDLAASLGTSEPLAQLTLSVCLIGLALGQLILGPLSDLTGRLRPLLVGVFVLSLTSLLCAIAPNIWVLLVLRFLQGLSGAAGIVIARAMVRDVYTGARAARVFSQLMLVMGAAPILAPVFGGQLLRFTDWRGLFVALAGVGFAMLIAARLILVETHAPSARSAPGLRVQGRTFGRLLSNPEFRGYFLLGGLHGTILFTYISMSPFVLRSEYGIGPSGFSLIFAANAAGLILASQVNALVVLRVGPAQMLQISLILCCSAAALLVVVVAVEAPLPYVLVALFFVILSLGGKIGNQMALGLAPHGAVAGAASALLGMSASLFGSIIPPVVSLGGVYGWVMGATIAAAAWSSLVVWLLVLRPRLTAHVPSD